MYLFVEKSAGLENVPDELLAQFGELLPVMTLRLTPERKLARTDAALVLASIQERGFFLQMPPAVADVLARKNRNA